MSSTSDSVLICCIDVFKSNISVTYYSNTLLTLMHSERPKLYTILAFSECNRVNRSFHLQNASTKNVTSGNVSSQALR